MKSKVLALSYLCLLSILGLVLYLILIDNSIRTAGTAFDLFTLLIIILFTPLLFIDHFKNGQASDAFAYETKKAVKAAKQKYRRTFSPFPRHLAERGAISRDLRTTTRTARPTSGRGTGRQHACSSTATRQAASGKSSGDDGDDGEPPRLPLLFPLLPLLFTYLAFAQLIGCATKTLRNRVSAGLFPPPIQTVFGPRFTQAHLAAALAPQLPADPAPTPKKRGRPRIAQGKGGAA